MREARLGFVMVSVSVRCLHTRYLAFRQCGIVIFDAQGRSRQANLPFGDMCFQPGRVIAGVSMVFLVCSNMSVSADGRLPWLVRRANRVIRPAYVRNERLRGSFPRVEHLPEARVCLKNEASAAKRQRPSEHRVTFGVPPGGGV